MNQLTSYEVLIAEKVAQLPVTDMADSIWANIEQQLGPDPSGDNNTDHTKPTGGKPVAGNGFYYAMLCVIIVTVVFIIYKSTNHKTILKTDQPAAPAPAIIIPVNKNVDSNPPVQVPGNKSFITPKPVLGKDSINNSSNNIIMPDTAFHFMPSVLRPDSIGNNKPLFTLPDSMQSQIKEPVKKPKAVKGISDEDYKILGTKKEK